MDIVIHWGVLRHLREDVGANPIILTLSIIFDAIVLIAFMFIKAATDPLIIGISIGGIAIIFGFEALFLRRYREYWYHSN